MPDVDLDAIKARCEAATPGPWFVERCGEINDPGWVIADAVRWQGWTNPLSFGEDRPTAEFVARARTDVVALVAELERLRRLRQSDQGAYEHMCDIYHGAAEEADELRAEVQRLRAAVSDLWNMADGGVELLDDLGHNWEADELRQRINTAIAVARLGDKEAGCA